jgi:predicted polyphosphate/ATP-dependent NAD kinase
MRSVGIIANPGSGKDIRRLIACGSVFDNNEKANILKRVFLALDSFGIEKVVIMPDIYGIGYHALEDLDVHLSTVFLDMAVEGIQDDSTRAAQIMADMDVACIITLGGDGTNRVVAKSCGDTPLLPISTGTNNVFPLMIEGTIAGMAAGAVAALSLKGEDIAIRKPRLEIYDDTTLIDVALVDVVVSDHCFAGCRANCDETSVYEIYLTNSEPGHIGFSAVGAALTVADADRGRGMHISVGGGNERVLAPIAPGMMRWIPIRSYQILEPHKSLPIKFAPSFLSLDGEREIDIGKDEKISILLNEAGPYVVDIQKALLMARDYVNRLDKLSDLT